MYGGIEHENLRLPALGGSLFDPDRFPFLEGRAKGSNWRTDAATPLPIDNRTVLLLLEAIQQFQGRTLSYRALDVEQIGYVYEGLLERTVKRTDEVTLELDATKSAKTPWIKLAELDSARLDGAARLAELLQERSGSSASRVRNDLAKAVDDTLADRLLTACQGDTKLRDRVKPYAHLLRTDPWGYPLVYPAGAFIVTTGSDRRETGTHYTPKSLTEAIVVETLTPVAYVGPAEGTPREQWALKSPAELLDLKICDPAMGSGAFLVQACRWLSDRLVEAWSQIEATGKTVSVDGDVLDAGATKEPLPRDSEARTVIARRLIAERCLYGVDLNPLAVELAKLSIWLVTLAKGRPFGFLDHNLRCGDSLLGIHRLDQLTQLSMNPSGQGQLRLFGQNIERAVLEAIELRQRLREMPIRDIRDVEAMAHLDADARRRLEMPGSIADAFIGEVFASGGNGAKLENALASLTIQAGQVIYGDRDALDFMHQRSVVVLSEDLPTNKSPRRAFNWPLEYPEVFLGPGRRGFDALIGNPPFVTGKRISTHLGNQYQTWLKSAIIDSKGAADLCVYFLRRAHLLVNHKGFVGLILTKSIAEGDSRMIGTRWLTSNGFDILWAFREINWPGSADVTVSLILMGADSCLLERNLNGLAVPRINSRLRWDEDEDGDPFPLRSNKGLCNRGVVLLGDDGFILSEQEYKQLLAEDPGNVEVISPYLTGMDLSQGVGAKPTSWVINFRKMPFNEASAYKAPFSRLTEKVKPLRDAQKGQIHEKDYWKYWDKREAFFLGMAGQGKILACSFTAKYWINCFIREEWVPSQSVGLFAFADLSSFSVMQSSIHEAWARKYSGKMRDQWLTYHLSRAFATFPFPASPTSSTAGSAFYTARSELAETKQLCLAAVCEIFHDPGVSDSTLEGLREFFVASDLDVLSAYGWTDIDLQHDFHEVTYLPASDRTRFTISETARLELLRRLSELNRQRYEEELAQGLQANATPRKRSRNPSEGLASSVAAGQPSLDFEATASIISDGSTPSMAILGFMRARDGWHAKADVLAATGITDGQWNAAITDLIAASRVERVGEKRGARYRIQPSERDDHHKGAA